MGINMDSKEIDIIGDEIAVTGRNMLLNLAPPGVGLMVRELIECRERIIQKRINYFVLGFEAFLKSVDPKCIDKTYIECEDYNDLFYSILQRVLTTKSEDKIKRFQKILINEAVCPYSSDFKETFLDLILRINEDQIRVLNYYRNLRKELKETSQGEQSPEVLDKIRSFWAAKCLNMDYTLLKFYNQDLISKSLLSDDGMGRLNTEAYDIVKISAFGLEFLEFIEGDSEMKTPSLG